MLRTLLSPASRLMGAGPAMALQGLRTPAPVRESLPIVGGIVGGTVGGVPGAAAGSGAGSFVANLLRQANQPQGQGISLKQAGMEAALSAGGTLAVGGLASGAGRLIGATKLPLLFSTPRRARFLENIRRAILDAKDFAGKQFGRTLDKLIESDPGKTVDLSGVLKVVQEKAINNPAFKALLDKSVSNQQESAMLQSILNHPEVATALPLKVAQQIKQIFQKPLAQKFEKVGAEFLESQLDMKEAWHGIRLAQLEAFPKNLAEAFKGYAETVQAFRIIRGKLGPNSLETTLRSNFEGRAELIEAAKKLLPKDLMGQIQQFSRASAVGKFVGSLPGQVAGYGTIGGLAYLLGTRR